jgi:hypothetical protein
MFIVRTIWNTEIQAVGTKQSFSIVTSSRLRTRLGLIIRCVEQL